ncbi:MAG: hypothetical protein JNM81_15750 [Rhodospirillaceae bacterium]|nr:hypothetical protein [Rhodospirillaceae bacterium]
MDSRAAVMADWPFSNTQILAFLFVWIAALRLPCLNFDVLSVDEAVYMALGSGLRHGLVPYVDLIDRKPIGIFLIYAFSDWAFPNGIVGVRLLGLLATFIASALLVDIAQRFIRLPPTSALLAGLFYSTYVLLFYGDSGQTPVFYMPLVIAGARLVFDDAEQLMAGASPSLLRTLIAGLLLGVSLQIKYSTVFECIFCGGLLLVLAWHKRNALGAAGLVRSGTAAGLMLVGGLLPTAVAYFVFASLGYGDAFVFYNFTANLTREATDFPLMDILFRSLLFTCALIPLFIKSVQSFATGSDWRRWVVAGWAIAALIGALAQFQPYATYFFDIPAPLSILAASMYAAPTIKLVLARAAVVLLLPVAGYAGLHIKKVMDNGSPYLSSRIAADIRALGPASMYNFNYYGIVHYWADIPLPTRYPYPDHLIRDLEGRSFQFDNIAEIARILATTPDVLLVQQPMSKKITAQRQAMIMDKATSDYCLWRTYQAGPQEVQVYLSKTAQGQAERACKTQGE